MARYMLTGIDDQKWRHFKALCDIQGITIKESFTNHINHMLMQGASQIMKLEADYHKKEKEGKRK